MSLDPPPAPAADFDDVATNLAPVPLPVEAPADGYLVTVVAGPDRGKQLSLQGSEPGPSIVGTGAAAALRLTDAAVSRRHLSLESAASGLRLRDLGSTNGTVLDGHSIIEVFLRGGELLRLGQTVLRIEATGAASPASVQPVARASNFGRMLGQSVEMRRLYPLAKKLANSNIPVLIEGETGTGKEVLAEALHEASRRSQGPYVVLDCTTVTPSLIESELFGHERGAFTGAQEARRGVFEQANGGTLFIDEVGDLPLSMQGRLLRAVERAEIRRVGGGPFLPVDVRVLAATRRNLDREIEAGRFREDLFHRLAVARIELPPLGQRTGDVPFLFKHFWDQLGGAGRRPPPALVARMEVTAWPGNVRQLRNEVARYLALGELDVSLEGRATEPANEEIGGFINRVLDDQLPLAVARTRIVERFERLYLERALGHHGGNVSRAADAAGVARRYFQLLRSRRV